MFWFIVAAAVAALLGGRTWWTRGRRRNGVDLGRVLRSRGVDDGKHYDQPGGF